MARPTQHLAEGRGRLRSGGISLKSRRVPRPFSVWKTEWLLPEQQEGQSSPGRPADIRSVRESAACRAEPQSGPMSRSDTVHKRVTLGLPWPSVGHGTRRATARSASPRRAFFPQIHSRAQVLPRAGDAGVPGGPLTAQLRPRLVLSFCRAFSGPARTQRAGTWRRAQLGKG